MTLTDNNMNDTDGIIDTDMGETKSPGSAPGKQGAVKGGGAIQPRRTRRATFARPHGYSRTSILQRSRRGSRTCRCVGAPVRAWEDEEMRG